jgi:hypothetical protein
MCVSYRLSLIAVAISLGTLGCGGSSSAPTSTHIPAVNGSYSGNATYNFPELQQSLSCPATTVVTQNGGTVSIAPMVLRGECDNLSIPMGQMTIDTTGAIDGGSAQGTFNEPTCGTYNATISGGFFGRELRISMTATSSTCYNFTFTSVLSR